MEKNIVLRVENLNVDFGKERILEDLTFDLKEKELLVILGPNGAGKKHSFENAIRFNTLSGKNSMGK
jgi:ABC-type Mn2+/Zn2+ transport system ATPase subunit